MAGEPGAADPPPPGSGSHREPDASPGTPRASPMLVASLVISALSLALPAAFGPLGPMVAGVLAFLGYRRVRASGGLERGPVLAKAAMSFALALLVVQGWVMVRHAATRAAWASLQEHASRVDANLRSGTPEGAYELLAPEARAATDRAAFVERLRAASAALGPLRSLGESAGEGGDWEKTATFEEGGEADLRLPLRFDARFERGSGRVEMEVLLRRRGRSVTGSLVALRVTPTAAEPAAPR